ncbi:hypothetical protein RI367_003096 [Sorochytrium milnesiophthora]
MVSLVHSLMAAVCTSRTSTLGMLASSTTQFSFSLPLPLHRHLRALFCGPRWTHVLAAMSLPVALHVVAVWNKLDDVWQAETPTLPPPPFAMSPRPPSALRTPSPSERRSGSRSGSETHIALQPPSPDGLRCAIQASVPSAPFTAATSPMLRGF